MGQLWIEPVGSDLIMVRVHGILTEALLEECHRRVFQLVKDTKRGLVLYNALKMEAPSIEVTLSKQHLDKELVNFHLRRAIVVPNTKLAYLARLAFAEDDSRVFYDDIVAAIRWLTTERDPE